MAKIELSVLQSELLFLFTKASHSVWNGRVKIKITRCSHSAREHSVQRVSVCRSRWTLIYNMTVSLPLPQVRCWLSFLSNFSWEKPNSFSYITYVVSHSWNICALRGSIYVPLRVILSNQESHLLLCLYGQIPGTFCLCKGAFSEGDGGRPVSHAVQSRV